MQARALGRSSVPGGGLCVLAWKIGRTTSAAPAGCPEHAVSLSLLFFFPVYVSQLPVSP